MTNKFRITFESEEMYQLTLKAIKSYEAKLKLNRERTQRVRKNSDDDGEPEGRDFGHKSPPRKGTRKLIPDITIEKTEKLVDDCWVVMP